MEITKERLEALKAKLVTIDAVHKEIAALPLANVSPVALIEIILAGAMGLRASDIHTEAGEKKAKIRFRIDGLLHDMFDDIPLGAYHTFVSRIKLLSEMKLNVRDAAQDGRFTIGLGEQRYRDARVGDPGGVRRDDRHENSGPVGDDGRPAATSGLRADNLALVKKQIAKPNGLILNTGPTGSGKTTTLYAFLRTMNDPTMKIITLEDPIEYRIDGIEQTQVDDESGYTFANGLRAIVRQDPDVILVGEVRDLETADIALQAALTGHLVLSTLHTNDAVGAVPRLINLGVKAVSIGPALSLAIAQRLVRVLCPDCKKEAASGCGDSGEDQKSSSTGCRQRWIRKYTTVTRFTRRWAAKSAMASDIKVASAFSNFWKAARILRKRSCTKRRRSRSAKSRSARRWSRCSRTAS